MKKKVLSMLLAVVMMIGIMPVVALANNTSPSGAQRVEQNQVVRLVYEAIQRGHTDLPYGRPTLYYTVTMPSDGEFTLIAERTGGAGTADFRLVDANGTHLTPHGSLQVPRSGEVSWNVSLGAGTHYIKYAYENNAATVLEFRWFGDGFVTQAPTPAPSPPPTQPQTMTGKYVSDKWAETHSEEYFPTIELFSNGRYKFTVNFYEGMRDISGEYTYAGNIVTCVVTDGIFTDFNGMNVPSSTMKFRVDGNRLIFDEVFYAGMTKPGDVFVLQSAAPTPAPAARPNFEMGTYRSADGHAEYFTLRADETATIYGNFGNGFEMIQGFWDTNFTDDSGNLYVRFTRTGTTSTILALLQPTSSDTMFVVNGMGGFGSAPFYNPHNNKESSFVLDRTASTPTPPPSTGGNLGGFQNESVNLVGVRLEWTPIPGSIGYRVFRSERQGELGIAATDFYTIGHDFVDVNIKPNTTYYYTVKQILREATVQGDPEVFGAETAQARVTSPGRIAGDNLTPPFAGAVKQTIVMTIDDPYMTMADGSRQEIDPGRGTVPLIRSGRTLVPIRAIIEGMGGSVEWLSSTRQAVLERGSDMVTMTLNSNTMHVNGNNENLDVAPTTINDRTFVPVRGAIENLGGAAEFINTTRQIVVVYY